MCDERAVRGRAAAHVVAHVEEAHGSLVAQRGIDRVGDGNELADEFVAVRDQVSGEVVRDVLGQAGIAVGHGDNGRTHFRHVRIGKPEDDAVGKDALLPQPRIRLFVEGQAGRRGRVLALDADGHGREGCRLHGTQFTRKGPGHERRGLQTPLLLVQVRVGAVGDGGVASRDHAA